MYSVGPEVLAPLFIGVASGIIATIIIKILKDYGWKGLLVTALIFFVIGVAVTWMVYHHDMVAVPNIVGYSEGDAERIIEENDLVFNDIDRTHSDTVQKYKVISQDPPPGIRVKKGSVVNVVVSMGPQISPTLTPTVTPTPTPISIQITDPKAGDYVQWRYTVKGTSNIDSNSDLNIYVFIWARNWYVQPKAIISSNGDWETGDRCRFGNPEYGGLNYTYDICAIVTTKDFEVDEQFANLPDYKAKSKIITVTRE